SWVVNMRECRLLTELGRAAAAVTYCARSIALGPVASPAGHTYARALEAAGNTSLAQQQVERFARFHPDSIPTRQFRFELALFHGAYDEAMRLIRSPGTRPQSFRP